MKNSSRLGNAKQILSRVPDNVSFWLCTGAQLRSLNELSSALNGISDDVFRYHVNRDKNDFENWIRDVIHDKELAREISRIKTKETLCRKIQEGVWELKVILRKNMVKTKKNPTARKRRAKKAKSRKGKVSKPTKKPTKKVAGKKSIWKK